MTDGPEAKARGHHAVERSTLAQPGEPYGTVHPEELASMERAMLSLPQTTREIFFSHRLDGFSYDHIASVTGLSRRQVERHMRTSLRRLDRYMDGDERTGWQRWWQAYVPQWLR